MRNIEITPEQNTVNQIHAKQGFSVDLKQNLNRYVIGYKTLLVTSNPSTHEGVHTIVNTALFNAPARAEVFGGWLGDDGLYYLDYSTTSHTLGAALAVAKLRKELAIWDRLEEKVIPVK